MKTNRIFYALIALVIAAAVFTVALLLRPGSVPTAEVILPTPAASGGQSGQTGDESAEQRLSVTPDTVQAALATLQRCENYSRTVTVERFWSGGGSSSVFTVRARGGSLRAVFSQPEDGKNILINDGKVYVWYTGREGVYSGPEAESDADRLQGLIGYEEILSLTSADILDAGSADLDGEYCIYAEYTSGRLGLVKRCWVSAGTGLLMRAEIYDGDSLIYTMSSDKPDISTPDDGFFALP